MASLPSPTAPIAEREAFYNQVYQTGRTGSADLYKAPAGASRAEKDAADAASEAAKRATASRNLAGISLEKSIPEVTQSFTTARTALSNELDPLKERYQNLIDEVQNYGNRAVKNVEVSLSRELGRRGILQNSGLGERTINEGVNPILAEYASKTKDIGFERETKLRDISNQIAQLTDQEVAAKRAVQNSIAQLQTSGSQYDAQLAAQAFQASQVALQQAQQYKNQLALEYAKLQASIDASKSRIVETAAPSVQASYSQATSVPQRGSQASAQDIINSINSINRVIRASSTSPQNIIPGVTNY